MLKILNQEEPQTEEQTEQPETLSVSVSEEIQSDEKLK